MEISGRLAELRRRENMSQTAFAKRLKVNPSLISKIESGSARLTEQSIDHICLVFGVNDAWLRCGKGEMYAKKPVEDEERLLSMFRLLSREMRALVLKKIQELLAIDEEKWEK
ncbi:MAG: helix-turn-helix domain-containing protein [Treponema sp.]|jgi:transcriptional regulator with XRE-family HTH domain|nr:helix-turn-helix domain-containing protein [Treponema sp.]